MTETSNTTSSTREAPASHVAVAMLAVCQHMVDRDLPVFVEMRPVADRIEVFLFERPFDMWVATMADAADEVLGAAYPSGALGVHVDATLPTLGIRVRLRSSREVQPAQGRRKLAAVPA